MNTSDDDSRESITIEPANEETVKQLKMAMPLVSHDDNFRFQNRGEGVYLVAWWEDSPVGYALIRWNEHSCVEALEVQDDFEYREEAGNQLLKFAENIIQKRGFNSVGIAVHLTNTNAIKFYLGLGYLPQKLIKSSKDKSKWCISLEKFFTSIL